MKGNGVDNLIVLGLIPGTDIQITFEMWLQFVTSLLAAIVTVRFGIVLIGVERSRTFSGTDLQPASD